MPLNPDKLNQIVSLARQMVDLFEEAAKEPLDEPVLNKSRLAKATGFGTRTIAELMRSGVVPTFDQGKKAKASDIQKAMQDRPARMVGQLRRLGTNLPPFKRLKVY